MKLSLVVAVLVLGGCKKTEKKPENKTVASGSPVQPTDKPCELDPGGSKICNFVNCGGNSAIINAFPLNGFRTNGDCNEDQMQVRPKSMEGGNGGKCANLTLDIEGDKLIGIDGTTKCEGLDLENASFEVRTNKGTNRITIVEVTEYSAPNGKKFPAYRMESKDNSGNNTVLCAKGGQKMRDKLGVSYMKWSDDLPDPEKELVIPIVSELYDDNGKAVPKRPWWKDQTKVEWNHLACVDDALAKRTINGHHKPSDPAAHAKNRAALRMWTADYCGGRPFTMRGRLFDWSGNQALPFEAQWTEDGAVCLDKPRIIFNNGKEEAPSKTTKLLDAFCKASGKDCKLAQTWTDEARICTKPTSGNSTTTVDHVIPKECPPCTGPDCPRLESRNVNTP